jgi:integrase
MKFSRSTSGPWNATRLTCSIQGCAKTGLSTFTANSYVRTVNVFLSWARAEGEQVSAKGKLARTPQKLVETLTREEILSMGRIANHGDALIVQLADTGIRAGELCGLQIDSRMWLISSKSTPEFIIELLSERAVPADSLYR